MYLHGRPVAQKIIDELKARRNPIGALAVIQVGDDATSNVYIRKKREMAEALGIEFRHLRYPAEISEAELIQNITKLNLDDSVSGILIQMPLPKIIDQNNVCAKIDENKDVDGFNFILSGGDSGQVPPTVLAIDQVIEFYNKEKKGKKILIVGGGFLVGRPLFDYWQKQKLDVSILDKNDSDYNKKLREADIVVLSTGGGGRFSEKDFRVGAVVVDASTMNEDGVLRGDVNLENWPSDKDIAPVPGGIGPVTVACLFANIFKISENPKF